MPAIPGGFLSPIGFVAVGVVAPPFGCGSFRRHAWLGNRTWRNGDVSFCRHAHRIHDRVIRSHRRIRRRGQRQRRTDAARAASIIGDGGILRLRRRCCRNSGGWRWVASPWTIEPEAVPQAAPISQPPVQPRGTPPPATRSPALVSTVRELLSRYRSIQAAQSAKQQQPRRQQRRLPSRPAQCEPCA